MNPTTFPYYLYIPHFLILSSIATYCNLSMPFANSFLISSPCIHELAYVLNRYLSGTYLSLSTSLAETYRLHSDLLLLLLPQYLLLSHPYIYIHVPQHSHFSSHLKILHILMKLFPESFYLFLTNFFFSMYTKKHIKLLKPNAMVVDCLPLRYSYFFKIYLVYGIYNLITV